MKTLGGIQSKRIYTPAGTSHGIDSQPIMKHLSFTALHIGPTKCFHSPSSPLVN